MQKWIDTHAHYDLRRINDYELIKDMFKTNQKIITLGTNTKCNLETLKLISLFDDLYGMIGFFPNNAAELEPDFVGKKKAEENWLVFTKQLMNQKIVGIGEIGLDFYHNSFGFGQKLIKGPKAREYQIKYLKKQLDFAKELNIPVSLHSRDAKDVTKEVFDEYKELKGVMHCFSYDIETVKYYLDKGLYIGVGGTVTYKNNNSLRDAIKEVPLDRILLETDAPYLTPEPFRRSTNDSSFIEYVIKKLAEIKEVSEDTIIKETNKNAEKLFNFYKK